MPLSSGALLGSQRALSSAQTWTAWNGQPLLPVHPLTAASQQPVVPGTLTRQDIQIFPTMAELPAGWRLRVTLTTSDTPHLVPALSPGPGAGRRHLPGPTQHGAASVLNVPSPRPRPSRPVREPVLGRRAPDALSRGRARAPRTMGPCRPLPMIEPRPAVRADEGDISIEEIEDAVVDGDSPVPARPGRPGRRSPTAPSASSSWAPSPRTSARGCRTSSWAPTPTT